MTRTAKLRAHAPANQQDQSRIHRVNASALDAGDQVQHSRVVKEIQLACADPGYFTLHQSCVQQVTIQRAIDASAAFFALPDDSPVKRAVHNRHAASEKGWGPLYGEPAYQPGTLAHVESFDMGQPLSAEESKSLGLVPNLWPQLPGFQAALEDLYSEMTRLGRQLAEVISDLLGAPGEFINLHSGPAAPRTLRSLHYPANPAAVSDGRDVGIAAHTDFECFTLMIQTAPGLELTDATGTWFEAPSSPGDVTVILGDMTERLCNGRYPATGHRVTNTPWVRQSLVLFFALDGAYPVAPLPQWVTPDRPDAYGEVTQDAHIANELQRAAANTSPKH